MMPMNLAELVVAFNPEPTANRLARARTGFIFRIVSALVSLGVCFVIMYTVGKEWTQGMLYWMFGTWGAVSLAWLIASVVSWVSAKRDLKRIGVGPAVTLSPAGIGLNGRQFAWRDVSRVWATSSYSGAGPKLVVVAKQGDWEQIPFSYLDAMPATIDSALRAYGQPPLDLSALDAML